MRTTKGECRINGLHITEVKITNERAVITRVYNEEEIDPTKPPTAAVMEAVYATLEARTDPVAGLNRQTVLHTHGRCTATPQNWSRGTLQLLAELLDSMEKDLIPRHFQESADMEDDNARFEPGADEEARQV